MCSCKVRPGSCRQGRGGQLADRWTWWWCRVLAGGPERAAVITGAAAAAGSERAEGPDPGPSQQPWRSAEQCRGRGLAARATGERDRQRQVRSQGGPERCSALTHGVAHLDWSACLCHVAVQGPQLPRRVVHELAGAHAGQQRAPGRARQLGHGQRRRDRLGRRAGPGQWRDRGVGPHVRQGAGAERGVAAVQHGAQVHGRQVLHALGTLHPERQVRGGPHQPS